MDKFLPIPDERLYQIPRARSLPTIVISTQGQTGGAPQGLPKCRKPYETYFSSVSQGNKNRRRCLACTSTRQRRTNEDQRSQLQFWKRTRALPAAAVRRPTNVLYCSHRSDRGRREHRAILMAKQGPALSSQNAARYMAVVRQCDSLRRMNSIRRRGEAAIARSTAARSAGPRVRLQPRGGSARGPPALRLPNRPRTAAASGGGSVLLSRSNPASASRLC